MTYKMREAPLNSLYDLRGCSVGEILEYMSQIKGYYNKEQGTNN